MTESKTVETQEPGAQINPQHSPQWGGGDEEFWIKKGPQQPPI